MTFTGSELTGVAAHKSPVGAVVAATVGLVVGAAVGGAGVLGAGVVGAVVAATVGLVVGATVGGATVGLVVGAGVLGAGVLGAGVLGATTVKYVDAVLIIWSGTIVATWAVIVEPEAEVRRKVIGPAKARPGEEIAQ
jgi:hypothetical protein